MGKNVNVSGLKRVEATSTQTKKHRYERYKNVENIFCVNEPGRITWKKILLVDDVITTGSTLISCAEAICNLPGTTVYVAAIAAA